ncbi:hypothetical protein ACJ73_05308 [Blastomyces percursus]|uniref:Uncharacterized protein n=1 Tax=Blastomyces percursus TaxID=1658174 RepID=A0A1J9Q4A2_9EURO|nr:hypothetical protein ACJ73_05308 [Blastomyces percursus]
MERSSLIPFETRRDLGDRSGTNLINPWIYNHRHHLENKLYRGRARRTKTDPTMKMSLAQPHHAEPPPPESGFCAVSCRMVGKINSMSEKAMFPHPTLPAQQGRASVENAQPMKQLCIPNGAEAFKRFTHWTTGTDEGAVTRSVRVDEGESSPRKVILPVDSTIY